MVCSIFYMLICIFSLVRYQLRLLANFLIGLFVFLLLNFNSSLYILDNSPLGDVFFANIFCHSMVCLLIVLTLSFPETKFLILMKSNLSIIIIIMDHDFGIVSKKSSPYPRTFRFSPVLSSRNFIVLCFILRSLVHFKLIFMKGLCLDSFFFFFFLHVDVWLFQHHLFFC